MRLSVQTNTREYLADLRRVPDAVSGAALDALADEVEGYLRREGGFPRDTGRSVASIVQLRAANIRSVWVRTPYASYAAAARHVDARVARVVNSNGTRARVERNVQRALNRLSRSRR